MNHGILFARRGLDHLADAHDLAPFVRGEPQAERRGVGNDIEHAAVGNVDGERTESRDLERHVEMHGEGGHIPERDVFHLPIGDFSTDSDQTGRASRTISVTGSSIGSMPVSSSTVATQIVLLPDIGG